MIEARNLVKRYGSTMAVNDLSFFIRPGLVTGFPRPERRREDHHHADDPGPAEWTKLRSVRSTFWALTVTVVLGIALGAVISVATAHGYAKFSVSQS